MNTRFVLPIPLLVVVTTCAAAFAPAPVYKVPSKPAVTAIEQTMQGHWSVSVTSKSKIKREPRVHIEGKTWTNLPFAPRGGRRLNPHYAIHLDTTQHPVALDLKHGDDSRVAMRGILEIKGNRLIYYYTTSSEEADRPRSFSDTLTASGRRVMTMTLTRIESAATSP